MKLIHTCDWHLGRKLASHDVHKFQEAALDYIVDTAIEQRCTVVMVSGDVFDGPHPPIDSVLLVNRILTRMHKAGIFSIITAGNHDQAERLAVYSNLLVDSVRIIGSTLSLTQPVELSDEHGAVLVYPVTFLWPDAERHNLTAAGEDPLDRSHEAVTGAALARVRDDQRCREGKYGAPVRTVVMAHAFVTPAGDVLTAQERAELACESERDLSIGGVQTVPSAMFDGFTYVALGHLHLAHQVAMPHQSPTLARYGGSLLRYSLSETVHEKSFAVVTLGAYGIPACVQLVPIPQGRGMARLRDTLENLISDKYAAHYTDFVELVSTDRDRPDHLYTSLNYKYDAIIAHHHISEGLDADRLGMRPKDSDRYRHPLETLKAFVSKVTGFAATAAQAEVLASCLESEDVVGD